MTKKMLALALALVFVASTATFTMARGSINCEVIAIEGKTVTLECKTTDKLNVGDKVRVRPPRKAMEGC